MTAFIDYYLHHLRCALSYVLDLQLAAVTPRGLEDHSRVGFGKLDDEGTARSEATIACEQFPSYYFVSFDDAEFELDLLAFSS